MKSVDTNVLARFFIDDADDPQSLTQRPTATAAMSDRVFVSVTVLLEFEWVMRGFYEMPRKSISKIFRAMLGIEHLTIENRSAVIAAADAFDAGFDFADALHVALSATASSFVTFDQKLAKRARAVNLKVPVELLR